MNRTVTVISRGLEGVGEVLQVVVFLLLGAAGYALYDNPDHYPWGLIVAVIVVGAVGMPAALASEFLRMYHRRAARRTTAGIRTPRI